MNKKHHEPVLMRQYQREDLERVVSLFYDTVHTVNTQDYTEEHCYVWANDNLDLEAWHRSLSENASYENIFVESKYQKIIYIDTHYDVCIHLEDNKHDSKTQ